VTKLSLVSLPVRAYTVTASDGGPIHLNQLHAECHSRINYKKTCPIHGEVANDQIVSGYEYSKGHYVVIDPEEVDMLRTPDEKAINIDSFVPPNSVDPLYFSGRGYYLLPDGPAGMKPYALLVQGMVEMKKIAVAQVVMHGRDLLMLIRPVDGLLNAVVLDYENQVTKPAAFKDSVPTAAVGAEELQLTKSLIEASTPKKLDLAKYHDHYTEKLTQLIEKKVAGEEVVAPPIQEQAPIINLMDALKESLAKAQKQEPEAAEKPPKKMAASGRKPARSAKRKSG
jgi:DNA end-binding protein Ku